MNSIIVWVILGAVAGWLGSVIMKTDASQGLLMNVVVGIVGACIGGYLFSMMGQAGVTGLNLYSILVATVGSVVALWVVKALR
jgi:uncharacterized membrane protein YeaQ/YmgE (transglycosylase-associated protein family)